MITARLKSSPLQSDPQYLGPMNSLATHNKPHPDFPPLAPEQMARLLVTAHSILDQVSALLLPPLPSSPLHSHHPQVFAKFSLPTEQKVMGTVICC